MPRLTEILRDGWPSHWTWTYVVDRSRDIVERRRHPHEPWLVPAANAFLDKVLRRRDVLFEFGSGRSTVWFARRVGRVVSVEHDAQWHKHSLSLVERAGLDNVALHACGAPVTEEEYLAPLAGEPDGSLDMVLVDGLYRAQCTRSAMGKLRAGGLLVIDNVERFLPCHSSSPEAIGPDEAALPADWQPLWVTLREWRCYWVTNGVTHTAIFWKPCGAD